MRKAFAAAALLVVLAFAGGASARSFTIVPTGPAAFPSSETPNPPGSINVPFPLSVPPGQPAVRSYEELLSLWRRAGDTYGVPWQVLAAINKIESDFGRNMGPSSAGAVGWMQFMPDTWLRWGMDANGDGLADPWNPDDAVFAAARYLAAAGAHDDISRAVFAYNHAQWYVDEVLGLAADFGSGGAIDFTGSQAVFRLDELQQRIAKARRDVARAREAVPRIERRVDESTDRQLRLELKAGNPKISTSAFRGLETRIAHLERSQARDRRQIDVRQADLAAALARLQSLKSDLTSASVAAPTAASFGGAVSSGDYAFPVGGGPDAVSVAHTHHDYPAADIAAPEGSPLFALADSVVVDVFTDGSGRCGDRLQDSARQRRRVRLLPPQLSRAERRPGRRARRGRGGRPRRLHRPRHGTAPPPPVLPCGLLSAGRAVVPVLRRCRVQLAGRADPHSQADRAQERAAFHGRRDHSRVLGKPHRGLYPLGA